MCTFKLIRTLKRLLESTTKRPTKGLLRLVCTLAPSGPVCEPREQVNCIAGVNQLVQSQILLHYIGRKPRLGIAAKSSLLDFARSNTGLCMFLRQARCLYPAIFTRYRNGRPSQFSLDKSAGSWLQPCYGSQMKVPLLVKRPQVDSPPHLEHVGTTDTFRIRDLPCQATAPIIGWAHFPVVH